MDPTTQSFLVWVFGLLPSPYNVYAADTVGIAGVLSIAASFIAFKVKPPSSEAPKWLHVAYKALTWPAINFGWARNAVVPGMSPVVQQAAKEAAIVAAKVPELQTVAPMLSAAGAPVIVSVAPGPTLANVIVAGTKPLAAIGLLLTLSACTATQLAATVQDGQLVCGVGTTYQAMRAASGQAILAKGATATAVADVCGLLGGVAVALPDGATAVTVRVPASVVVPLG